MIAIYKREMSSYFHSPIGWVVVAVATFLAGFVFALNASNGYSNIEAELEFLLWILKFTIPIITMRLFSEERKNATEVLLYTSPISLFRVVIGKYLAAMTLFLIMISTTLIHVFLTLVWGGRIGATTFGAYLVFIFVAAVFVALGTFTSAVTENQIVAAIISFLITFLVQLLPNLATSAQSMVSTFLGWINFFGLSAASINSMAQACYEGIIWIDPFSRMTNMNQGIFDVSPLVYSLSLSIFFLFLTYRIMEKKRWSQG